MLYPSNSMEKYKILRLVPLAVRKIQKSLSFFLQSSFVAWFWPTDARDAYKSADNQVEVRTQVVACTFRFFLLTIHLILV